MCYDNLQNLLYLFTILDRNFRLRYTHYRVTARKLQNQRKDALDETAPW